MFGRAAHQPHQNFRARTGVINDIPFEAGKAIETSPHAFVDLHQTDIASGGFKESNAIAATDELPPATLLPARGFDEVKVSLRHLRRKAACIDFALGCQGQKVFHGACICARVGIIDDDAVKCNADTEEVAH